MDKASTAAVFSALGHVAARLLDVMVPPACPLCRAPAARAGQLCARCWTGLRLIEEPCCPATGLPLLPTSGAAAAMSAEVFSEPWAALRAVAFHDGTARTLVHRLKYHDHHEVLPVMAQLMARALRAHVDADALLVPVPLYRWRLWRRRFNQSALLARALARRCGAAFMPQALVRIRPTRPQVGLSGKARHANVRGAFQVPDDACAALKGRKVILVDDVLTTGATARACAQALLDAGAAQVRVAVFALASRHSGIHT